MQIINGVKPGVTGIDYGIVTKNAQTGDTITVSHNLGVAPKVAILYATEIEGKPDTGRYDIIIATQQNEPIFSTGDTRNFQRLKISSEYPKISFTALAATPSAWMTSNIVKFSIVSSTRTMTYYWIAIA